MIACSFSLGWRGGSRWRMHGLIDLYQPLELMTLSHFWSIRHGWPCASHPRLSLHHRMKAWMAGTSPAMTMWNGQSIGRLVLNGERSRTVHSPRTARLAYLLGDAKH